jgi:hypothetical protein
MVVVVETALAAEAAVVDVRGLQVASSLLGVAMQLMSEALQLRRRKIKWLNTQDQLVQTPRTRPHLTAAHRMAHDLVHVVKVDWHPRQRQRIIPRPWGGVTVQLRQACPLYLKQLRQ